MSRQCIPIGQAIKRGGISLLLVVCLLADGIVLKSEEIAPYFVGDRILIDGKINQQPVHFILDTGASRSMLFGAASQRLQIAVASTREDSIADQPVQVGISKPLQFAMFGQEVTTSATILLVPGPPGIDGVLSWQNVSAPLLLIDGHERKVGTPREAPNAGWQRWQLEKESPQLFFVATKNGTPIGRVFIDTGNTCGLRLSPPLWKAWREQNADARVSLETFRYVVGDAMVHEMAWADEYALGDLLLRDVDIAPIPGAGDEKAMDAGGQEYIAEIGIRALRYLRVIVDRQRGELLTQSVARVPTHNRLGAVFVCEDGENAKWVCQVLEGGPAERAGLRDGDVLAEIDGLDFRSASGEAQPDPNALFTKPAGTSLKVTVERAGTSHSFSVELEDLLP